MPVFYFHLRDHHGVTADNEGRWLNDHAGAVALALAEARALIGADAEHGDLRLADMIEVADESGAIVHRLCFRDAVTITGLDG